MDRLKNPSRPRTQGLSVESERRLRHFIRGFGIVDEQALREVARRLARMAPGGDHHVVEVAAGVWFARLLGWPEANAARALAVGRLAWLSSGGVQRWPQALFADAPPHALADILRKAMPVLPPTMLDDHMPAATLKRPRIRHLFLKSSRLRPHHA